MIGQSASLFEGSGWLIRPGRGGFRSWKGLGLGVVRARGGWRERIKQRMRLRLRDRGCDVQRFRTSRISLRTVQLESLILAQNERWRQA